MRAEGAEEVHNSVLHLPELPVMAVHIDTFGFIEQRLVKVQHERLWLGAGQHWG
jgi:hypothetical protein